MNTRYKVYIAALLATVLLYAGCDEDFLVRKPTTEVSIDGFFTSQQDALFALSSTYASLQDRPMYSELYPKVVEAAADGFTLENTNDLEIDAYTWTAFNVTDNQWQECYEGIYRANLIVQNIPEIEGMDSALKDRVIAEAKFLRALYYWHLMVLFGEVPLVLEANPTDPTQAELPKSSAPELIAQMVKDLQEAIGPLPPSYGPEDIGRATEGAAKALLGKVYLYSASPLFGGNEQGYALAAEQFESVINDYGYELIDYEDLWVVDNNDESIFEVQYADIGGGTWAGGTDGNTNETNLRPELNLPNGAGGNGNLAPTQLLVDAFETYSGPDPGGIFDGRDPRLYWTVWTQGDVFDPDVPGTEIYQSSWSTTTGYNLKKGLFPVVDQNEDGDERNIPIIRLGDVMLMYAEAVNAMDPRDPQTAIDMINEIRARVNMPAYPDAGSPFSVDATSSQQEIFEAIVHERHVELAGEYVRYNDLRRWELAEEVLGPLGWQGSKHNFFPIPAEELDNNEQLEQNSNY